MTSIRKPKSKSQKVSNMKLLELHCVVTVIVSFSLGALLVLITLSSQLEHIKEDYLIQTQLAENAKYQYEELLFKTRLETMAKKLSNKRKHR